MKNFNILSVSLADLESAADTGIASQSVVMSIASDLLYLFRQALQLAAIPEQPVTDAHVQMLIDSHEKGYAMIVPAKIDLALAKEVQAHRKAAPELNAAKSTLEYKGYTWNGGQFWKPPLGKPPAYITMVQGKPEAVDGKMYVVWNIAMPAELHQDSQQLVHETAAAMAEKLARAQVKYGFDNGWKVPPSSASGDDGRHFWSRDECLTAFYHHLGKGDPLDCINYLAFMRANSWATQLPPQPEQQPAAEIITAGIGGYGCDALVSGLPIGTKLYAEPQPAPCNRCGGSGTDAFFPDGKCVQCLGSGGRVKSDLLQRAEKLADDVDALVERVGGAACKWSYDDTDHKWDGECGASWTFFEDGPAENSMKFCPSCGKPVCVVHPDEDTEAEDTAALAQRTSHSVTPRPFLTSCAAGRDGECNDPRCPQLRDGEPQASGRHCPIDHDEEDD